MKYLIIGLGSIGRRHIENLGKFDKEAEFFAFRQRNLSLADFIKKNKIKVFTDETKAFSDRYDAVFITNPTSMHMKFAILAAEKGNNLFIEKPVSNDRKGISELKRLVEKKQLITMTGYNLRFNPGLAKIKDNMKRLGRIYFARAQIGEYLPDWHPGEDYSKGYSARKEMGGGALLTLSHEVDYMLWLLGVPSSVFARLKKVSDMDIDVEDNVELILDYENKVIAEININYLQQQHTRTLQIVGENGELYWDYYANNAYFFDNKTKKKEILFKIDFERNIMYEEEMKHFIECLKQKKKPLVDIDGGINALEVCLCAKLSDNQNQAIKIKQFSAKLADIKLLALDFDGVLTDNRVLVDEDGKEAVFCSRGDGFGIEQLKKHGVDVIVISKEKNKVVKARCDKMHIECSHGVEDKLSQLKSEIKSRKIKMENVCFVGNDLNDIECIKASGFGVAVDDAHPEAKRAADYITRKRGSFGAVREITDMLCDANGS